MIGTIANEMGGEEATIAEQPALIGMPDAKNGNPKYSRAG
jgi:hypothetical protein